MKQVTEIPLFGIGSNRGRYVDAKAPVKPTRAPDLASASPPSGLALAIIGVGWKQSSCVLKDLTLQTGQNSKDVVPLSFCPPLFSSIKRINSSPFWGNSRPVLVWSQFSFIVHICPHCSAAPLKHPLFPLSPQCHTQDSASAGPPLPTHL